MSCKLLSFIGPSKYLEAYYMYNGRKSKKPCQFIQEALVEFFCERLRDEGQIVILLTDLSRRKNWLGKDECQDANFERGLRDRLIEQVEALKVEVQVRYIEIPEGKNEAELWEIFEKINSNIDEGDLLVLDVTHSFRSIPMLTLVALNYVRFLKDVKISRIVYGAMEALGSLKEVAQLPLEKRIIPIFDLTQFATLFDWTVGIERFLQTGNATMIRELGIEELKPSLVESRGRVGAGLKKLINSLNAFSQNVLTCRCPDLRCNIKRILTSLPEAEKELEKLKAFKPLFRKIKDEFSTMRTENDVVCGLKIASWCLEKGFIQQGFTILRETIVNYVIVKVLKSHDLKKPGKKKEANHREIATVMLNSRYKEIPDEILKLWDEIVDYRNDINHAGWREKNYHKAGNFESKLGDFIRRFEAFLQVNRLNHPRKST